jgi:hypothetical protein
LRDPDKIPELVLLSLLVAKQSDNEIDPERMLLLHSEQNSENLIPL